MTNPMDIPKVREAIAHEQALRRCDDEPGGYAEQPGQPWTLYASLGAVHIHAALGLPLGDRATRRAWAARLLSRVDAHGRFDGLDGHALCQSLACLHLLGEPIPSGLAPLAPCEPNELARWLDELDWSGTHKPFHGSITPLLASGLVSRAWTDVLLDNLTRRIDPTRPLETWCAADAPPWRVVSCIYHVTGALDAGCLVYPRVDLLIDRIDALRWEDAPDGEQRTDCTDADWAFLLQRLAEMRPKRTGNVIDRIRQVSARRVQQWHGNPDSVLRLNTFHIYCWLWSTAVFQHACRDHYRGPFIRDTLNDPALYRLT